MANRKDIKGVDSKILADFECVPLSEEIKTKMGLNEYDQLFLCALLKQRDKNITEDFYNSLTDFIANQYQGIGSQLTEQNKIIRNIEVTVNDLKSEILIIGKRVEHLETFEDYAKTEVEIIKKDVYYLKQSQKWYNIAFRITLGIVCGSLILVWIHTKVLNHKKIIQNQVIETIK